LKTLFKIKIIQPYILKYHFLEKNKVGFKSKAKISEDKITGITISFVRLSAKPESTNLEVVLETDEVN
jgi:hypothetical protein